MTGLSAAKLVGRTASEALPAVDKCWWKSLAGWR